MAKRARLTVFSRFLIMMIIVGPLAYLGASWYNGEDGIQNIKNIFNSSGQQEIRESPAPVTRELDEKNIYKIRDLQEELSDKDQQIEALKAENERLRQQLEALQNQ